MTPTLTDDPVVPVTMYVQQSLAMRAQARFAAVVQDLLSEEATAASAPGLDGEAFKPLDTKTALTLFPDAWAAPQWSGDDATRAHWLVGSLEGTALAGLLGALVADAGGTDADGLVAFDDMTYPKRSIPTALKHLALRCRQCSRRPMWAWDGQRYSMDSDVAAMFKDAMTGA